MEKHSKFDDQHLDRLFGMKLHKFFLLAKKSLSRSFIGWNRDDRDESEPQGALVNIWKGKFSHRNNSYATSGPLVFEPNFHCVINMRNWHSK